MSVVIGVETGLLDESGTGPLRLAATPRQSVRGPRP